MHQKNEHLAFLKITYYARRFLSTSFFFVLYEKREKKNTQKGVDAESTEGAGRLAGKRFTKKQIFKIWKNRYLSEESS